MSLLLILNWRHSHILFWCYHCWVGTSKYILDYLLLVKNKIILTLNNVCLIWQKSFISQPISSRLSLGVQKKTRLFWGCGVMHVRSKGGLRTWKILNVELRSHFILLLSRKQLQKLTWNRRRNRFFIIRHLHFNITAVSFFIPNPF